MDINLIATKQDIENLGEKILKFFSEQHLNPTNSVVAGKPTFLRSVEARKLLKVSDNRLRDMRNNREIPFTLIGKTYYYSESAIIELMNANMRKANP